MSAPIPAPAPVLEYIQGNAGVPAEGLQADFSSVPQPTDGDHVVQTFGPKVALRETDNVAQGFFEYSRCCGNRKALLIGINYFGTGKGELRGCINDVKNIQKFIIDRFGYTNENIVLLSDDTDNPDLKPTKANILKYMKWLVKAAKRDDALFFHFSGHGSRVKGYSHNEADKQDEAICPVDHKSKGLLTDNESDHTALVKPLPAGCRLTAIFDSCHSGTIMDIPYLYEPDKVKPVKEPKFLFQNDAKSLLESAGQTVISSGGSDDQAFDKGKSMQIMDEAGASPADVICWSGSLDREYSYDAQIQGEFTGVMSWAFITCLTKDPKPSYMKLLVAIRNIIQKTGNGRWPQTVQLSSCHPIDTNLDFVA